jgi:DNA-binding NarL/FixJ family response regulator
MPLATILVEDSPAIRSSLIPALGELADVDVIATAETADQAVAALKAHEDKWRLAVVDMLLKAGNGLQVLRAGKERRSDQYMVVLTNYATPDNRRKATELGADACSTSRRRSTSSWSFAGNTRWTRPLKLPMNQAPRGPARATIDLRPAKR